MTFDPFGDFESRGYLRNSLGEKDMAIVKDAEHIAFGAVSPHPLLRCRPRWFLTLVPLKLMPMFWRSSPTLPPTPSFNKRLHLRPLMISMARAGE